MVRFAIKKDRKGYEKCLLGSGTSKEEQKFSLNCLLEIQIELSDKKLDI